MLIHRTRTAISRWARSPQDGAYLSTGMSFYGTSTITMLCLARSEATLLTVFLRNFVKLPRERTANSRRILSGYVFYIHYLVEIALIISQKVRNWFHNEKGARRLKVASSRLPRPKKGKHADGGKLITFRTAVSQLYREELTRRSNEVAQERGGSVIAHRQLVLSKFIEEMTSDQERDATDYQEQRNTSGLQDGLSRCVLMGYFFHILTPVTQRSGWLGVGEVKRGCSCPKAHQWYSCGGDGCMAR
jgi:hypothetical protein